MSFTLFSEGEELLTMAMTETWRKTDSQKQANRVRPLQPGSLGGEGAAASSQR